MVNVPLQMFTAYYYCYIIIIIIIIQRLAEKNLISSQKSLGSESCLSTPPESYPPRMITSDWVKEPPKLHLYHLHVYPFAHAWALLWAITPSELSRACAQATMDIIQCFHVQCYKLLWKSDLGWGGGVFGRLGGAL